MISLCHVFIFLNQTCEYDLLSDLFFHFVIISLLYSTSSVEAKRLNKLMVVEETWSVFLSENLHVHANSRICFTLIMKQVILLGVQLFLCFHKKQQTFSDSIC